MGRFAGLGTNKPGPKKMKLKHLFAAAVLALFFTAQAASAGPDIHGRLTILNNEFILKLYEPFEHDDSEAEDGSIIVTATELHVMCSKERRAELRSFVGKHVRFPYATVFAANTPQHCRPLVLPYGEDSERVFEIYPPGHELAGWPRDDDEAAPPEASPSPALPPEAKAGPPIAAGVDYSQEPGLPVEWEPAPVPVFTVKPAAGAAFQASAPPAPWPSRP